MGQVFGSHDNPGGIRRLDPLSAWKSLFGQRTKPMRTGISPAEAKCDDTAPTWAVLVVHGVGDTDPGATLEAFTPSLLESSKDNLREVEPPQVVMLPSPERLEDADPYQIKALPVPEDTERYPMHLRRAVVQ